MIARIPARAIDVALLGVVENLEIVEQAAEFPEIEEVQRAIDVRHEESPFGDERGALLLQHLVPRLIDREYAGDEHSARLQAGLHPFRQLTDLIRQQEMQHRRCQNQRVTLGLDLEIANIRHVGFES